MKENADDYANMAGKLDPLHGTAADRVFFL
jgi:hypothetical protein